METETPAAGRWPTAKEVELQKDDPDLPIWTPCEIRPLEEQQPNVPTKYCKFMYTTGYFAARSEAVVNRISSKPQVHLFERGPDQPGKF